jgi:hypothetical protein
VWATPQEAPRAPRHAAHADVRPLRVVREVGDRTNHQACRRLDRRYPLPFRVAYPMPTATAKAWSNAASLAPLNFPTKSVSADFGMLISSSQ